MDLTLNEIGYWLALYTVPRCGFSTVSMLLKKFTTPKQILLASHEELLAAGVNPKLASNLLKPDWRTVELCLRWGEQPQCYILHWGDLHYPALLREISSPPLILFVKSELSFLQLQQQALAIVGARNPTYTGLEIAHQLANELNALGFVIISGLARGIDAAAHQGALLSKGITGAVLGSGLEHIYPACHQPLALDILEKGGALFSEFFPYSSPKAEYFPRRNRIISGMSLGVIVVEATLRSGSLITAHYALDQGREVFAIPSSIRNPLSQGCHALLKEGATLVESCGDIIQGLSFLPTMKQHEIDNHQNCELNGNTNKNSTVKSLSRLDSQDRKLVECLGFEITSIDILMLRTGLTIDKLLACLSTLQLQGYIDVVPGGYVRK